ncbi:transcriptional regulator NanR [Aliiruegeria lutimaris]|uniref:Transcriptional regulator, GntR family n=1 Tax=Aliiruegeria lutimaris TaxID=571298 RepID=A0A1G8MSB8_9RHOB|nr:transcriptional regulator NanR [Aliiruegeria lutimaris]SDI70938.1 transcriptional regulator, GntR family [Aliiruegeria lutimaris]
MPQDTPFSKTPVEPIQRQKLSDQVFDRLWRMIKSGELAPGDAMPSERALMELFGVGRPAVREALQSLANKGLISISHGERSRVNELNATTALGQVDEIAKLLLSAEPSNVDHLKQLRKILEAGTVRLAAESCGAEDVRDLRNLIEEQRGLLGDEKAFIQADIAFHVRIAEITDNPLLVSVTRAMLTWLLEYYQPVLHWEGRENTTLQEHEKIADLLGQRDQEGAIRMMGDHLSRSDPLYISNATEN